MEETEKGRSGIAIRHGTSRRENLSSHPMLTYSLAKFRTNEQPINSSPVIGKFFNHADAAARRPIELFNGDCYLIR